MDHLHLPSDDISESTYMNRRDVLRGLGFGAAGLTALSAPGFLRGMNGSFGLDDEELKEAFKPAIGDLHADLFPAKSSKAYSIAPRTLTEEKVASTHNNFYEFTTVKNRPWQITMAQEPTQAQHGCELPSCA